VIYGLSLFFTKNFFARKYSFLIFIHYYARNSFPKKKNLGSTWPFQCSKGATFNKSVITLCDHSFLEVNRINNKVI
jgi:hypothetical protein